MEKHSKNQRILNIYMSLSEGKLVNKIEEALRFGVDERSIQRDIDDIRAFLDERRTMNGSDSRAIEYDRARKGFVMTGAEGSDMTNSEILAVTKILLESRAFTKKEINTILDKLVEDCVPLKNMKLVSDLIANEKYHYVELHHHSVTQEKLWELGEDIREHNLLEIKYTKGAMPKEKIKMVIEPVAILFSEYYFYLNAYIVEKDDAGNYVHRYNYPAIFRLDRIKAYRELGIKFKVPYANRFEEGEFRKRIQFMYAGRLMKIQFHYHGQNAEPILDRLPTAKVLEEKESCFLIEAEVYGKGIMMWLLSQGSSIEVLKPESLRNEMRNKLKEMLAWYE